MRRLCYALTLFALMACSGASDDPFGEDSSLPADPGGPHEPPELCVAQINVEDLTLELGSWPGSSSYRGACTVADIAAEHKALVVLDCADLDLPVELTIDVDQNPTTEPVPLILGQAVALDYERDPSKLGWSLRDEDERLLMFRLIDVDLPLYGDDEPTTPASLFAPYTLDSDLDDPQCPWSCGELGATLPPTCVCHRSLVIEFGDVEGDRVWLSRADKQAIGDGQVFVREAVTLEGCGAPSSSATAIDLGFIADPP